MFGATTKFHNNQNAVKAGVTRGAFRSFSHAAARISKDAKASIVKDFEPSDPGEPPHTKGQGGHNLKGAIRFAANKEGAVIGPMASVVGQAGEAHEFGGAFRGAKFPERPFMEPALMRNLTRFQKDWGGSVHE